MERISARARCKREYTWWPKYDRGHTGKLFISHHFIRGMLTIMELRQTIQKYRPPSESSLLRLEQSASHSHFFLSVQSWSELSRKRLQSYSSRRERMDLDLQPFAKRLALRLGLRRSSALKGRRNLIKCFLT